MGAAAEYAEEIRKQRKEINERIDELQAKAKACNDEAEAAQLRRRVSQLIKLRNELKIPESEKKRKSKKSGAAEKSATAKFDLFDTLGTTFANLEGKPWAEVEDIASYAHQRLLRAMRRSMGGCSPRQQQMLSMTLQGKSMYQIASELGVNPSTVSRCLKSAREHIREIASISEFDSGEADNKFRFDFADARAAAGVFSTMTETQAVYLYLYYGEWMSCRQIGALIGVDQSTVSRAIQRGLVNIAKYVGGGTAEFINTDAIADMLYELYCQEGVIEWVPQRALDAMERANIQPQHGKRLAALQTTDSDVVHRSVLLPLTVERSGRPGHKRQIFFGSLTRTSSPFLEQLEARKAAGQTGPLFHKQKRKWTRRKEHAPLPGRELIHDLKEKGTDILLSLEQLIRRFCVKFPPRLRDHFNTYWYN